MTPPTKLRNFGILEEFWWRKQVFSSNRLRILRKSIWGVVKWEGQNGTWTPLTEIAAIWVVWDLNTNGFLLLSPQIHRNKYISQSRHKTSIYPLWNDCFLSKIVSKIAFTLRNVVVRATGPGGAYFYLTSDENHVHWLSNDTHFFPPPFGPPFEIVDWSQGVHRQMASF